MEGRVLTWTLLCLGVDAIQVTIPKPVYEVARGDNVTLPCTYTTTTANQPVIVEWSSQADATSEETPVIIYYTSGGILDISPQYAGRASLDMDFTTKKVNLILAAVTLNDNIIFRCRVQIPTDQGSMTATTRLLVLVAPSTPECNIQGKAEYGQNVNLTCASREGSPPPTYKWDSRDVQNNLRPFDPKTTVNGGILSLFNISKDTSGYYICTSANKIRSATCNFTLSVMPPSMNVASTAAIIGGAAACLLALAIIIYCCCCRKKDKEDEYAMGVRDEEFHDKEMDKNGDGRRADGQEEIRSSENSNVKSAADHRDQYEERSERGERRDYDDRRRDYDDRRRDYDDRRSDYDDRRRDYDDRRSDHDDRRSDYDDRRSDYDDRRSDYSDRRDKYRDRHERYDDDRRYNDRRDRRYDDQYDEPYDDRDRDRDRDRPLLPSNKPPKRNNDD